MSVDSPAPLVRPRGCTGSSFSVTPVSAGYVSSSQPPPLPFESIERAEPYYADAAFVKRLAANSWPREGANLDIFSGNPTIWGLGLFPAAPRDGRVGRMETTVAQKLYLDECTPPLLKARLLLPDPYRFTIAHVLQVARGMSDAAQLRCAVHMHATLVTYNGLYLK